LEGIYFKERVSEIKKTVITFFRDRERTDIEVIIGEY
jgi:hypothetical protein